MAYAITSKQWLGRAEQIEAILDSDADLSALTGTYAPGSTAVVANGGKTYMTDASGQWQELRGSSGGGGGGGGGVDTMTAAFTLAAGDDVTELVEFLDEALAVTPFVRLETSGETQMIFRYRISGGGGGSGSSTTISFGSTTVSAARNIVYNNTTKIISSINSAIGSGFTLTAYIVD